MMLYNKSSRAIKPKRKTINISVFEGIHSNITESVLPFKYSPMTYNFRFDKGGLVTGMGFENGKSCFYNNSNTYHTLPIATYPIMRCWHYKRYDKDLDIADDRIIIQDSEGDFFDTNLYRMKPYKRINNIETLGKTSAVNYRYNGEDVLLISSEYGKLYMYNGDVMQEIDQAPNITSMCIHYERIFATVGGERNQIWFSDTYDPTNWNVSMQEGGFIEFHDEAGRANRVVSFLDNVYIFRDYGINRLTAYGDQSEFNMAKLYTNSGRIYSDTISICGDRIIFMAEDGIYFFDGLTTRRALENIFPLIQPNKYCTACYFNGKYYLVAKIKDDTLVYKESEDDVTNTVIEYDIATGRVNVLRGVSVKSLIPINGINDAFMFAIFRKDFICYIGLFNYKGNFFNDILHKYWRTGESNLGYIGKKTIRQIYIRTQHPTIVRVIADCKEYPFYFDGQDGVSSSKINISGEQFVFVIESLESEAKIDAFSVVVDY